MEEGPTYSESIWYGRPIECVNVLCKLAREVEGAYGTIWIRAALYHDLYDCDCVDNYLYDHADNYRNSQSSIAVCETRKQEPHHSRS